MAQVILDRLRAQVEPGRGLARGCAFCQCDRDLKLLGCQLLTVAVITYSRGFSAGLELGHGPFSPRRRAELIESLQSRTQLLPCLDASAFPAEAFAEVELCPRALKDVRGGFVVSEGGLVFRDVPVVARQQGSCPGGARQREWLAFGVGGWLVSIGHLACFWEPS